MLNIPKLYLFQRLYEQVQESQERAITFYGKEAERLKLEWRDRTWRHGNIDSVDYSGINIVWEEYHRNCRTDSGRFSMPWEALADDTYKSYITDFVSKQVAKQNAEVDRLAALALAQKRAKLAQLKVELGEA
jgi:hypothetical protein